MSIAEQERTKYARMWTEVPDYRNTSPGQKLVPHFLRLVDWEPGESLIDLGCGPGRASADLAAAGLNVFQLDITDKSLDDKVRALGLPFIEACLWDMPALPKFDWIYCCDVLEHLPPIKVDRALDQMAAITGKGAWMQIALFAEGFGRHIGEVLHLTVMPADWWQEKINQRWSAAKYDVIESRLIVMTGAPK